MATATLSISHASIHRESGVYRAETLSWDMSSIPAGAVINYIRIRMYVGITARQKNYARVQNSSDNSIEYLREYRSGTYETSTVSTSRISSITLTFRADSTVYVDFSDFYAIVDYTVPYSSSTMNSASAEAGSALNFTISNSKLSELNHKIKLTFGTQSATVTVGRGVGTASYTVPMSWLEQMTDRASATGAAVLETYSGSTLVGSRSYSFTVTAPDSAAPTITLTLLQTGDARPSGWGMYLQTFSGVDLIASVQTQYLATMSSLVFSDGTKDSQNQYISYVPILFAAGEKTFTVVVTDSRGKQATATATITVEPYASPVFNNTTIARCDINGTEVDQDGSPLEDGTYVNMMADVMYSSCQTHNILSIAVDVDVDGVWVPVDDLDNGVKTKLTAPPTADFPDGFDPGTVYKFRVLAADSMGKSVSRVLYLQSISMLMHFRDSEDGMAVGMVSRRPGFEINPTWPVYCYGTELINLIYPVGSIYLSVSSVNPQTIFGGTWEQIKDTFLLACGDTYANAATGGEATHVLTENEMPSHAHYPTGSTATERDTWRAALIKDISGRSGKLAMSSGGDRYGVASNAAWEDVGLAGQSGSTGGGQAHNNMPPYLAVYMWKRTA